MTAVETMAPPSSDVAALVSDAEYARLLAWPRGRPLEGLVADRAHGARAWYAAHGNPWVAARRVDIRQVESSAVTLASGATFHGVRFAERVRAGSAHAVVAVALTAGDAVASEARRLWDASLPDESYFLDRFAAAVTEELLRWASVWSCRSAESRGETVLFHLSPGCGGWPFDEQPTLMGMVSDDGTSTERVRMLPSGGLEPVHSLLAVLALTRLEHAPGDARDACRSCDLNRCAFRRAPYRRTA